MRLKKTAIIAILLLIAVISFTKIAPFAASADNHQHSIEQTQKKVETVMKLSGGAAGASAILSLLPGDACTPIAQQLAQLATYFLAILSALYLEKFLITMSGYVVFTFFIPIVCVLMSVALLFNKKRYRVIASKIALIGIVVYMIVPASVRLSDIVYETQREKVENTINQYDDIENDESLDSEFGNESSSITNKMVDKFTGFLSGMLESLAVMIVTSCIIPILVFAFLVWMVKVSFSSNITIKLPEKFNRAKADKRKNYTDEIDIDENARDEEIEE
ncbi:hypothetical protein [Butyrivibrio sp. NC3005]|uniref:hypothetical protein n=1 Tax=Butyrivibrio sp. NC3005 TaxID=1280685 RepID=UPI00040D6F5D|nr:hypothetical protein [Butyrivibrio sp. NC3005]